MIGLPFPGHDLVHGFWVGLGILAGLGWYVAEKRRRGLHDDRLWVLAGMAVAFGAIGARVLTWPPNFDLARDPSLLDWWVNGNRSIIAGLVGAWLGVLLGKRLTGYPAATGDLFGPAIALALAIGRVGCLLTELPGTPTGGPWGFVLTPAQAAVVGGVPDVGLHPSFAYEVVFHAACFVVLLRLRGKLAREGDLFIAYVAAYALFRFAVEFVRGNEEVWWGLTRPQWFLLACLPLLGWRVLRLVRDARALSARAG